MRSKACRGIEVRVLDHGRYRGRSLRRCFRSRRQAPTRRTADHLQAVEVQVEVPGEAQAAPVRPGVQQRRPQAAHRGSPINREERPRRYPELTGTVLDPQQGVEVLAACRAQQHLQQRQRQQPLAYLRRSLHHR